MKKYIREELIVLSCNIDDFNPQNYEYVSERLFHEAKALDVWLTPIYMKKSRSANTLSVLTNEKFKDICLDIIFTETSTLGIREQKITRYSLERKFFTVATPYGNITCKVASDGKNIVHISAEYEQCKQAAKEHRVPLKEVQFTAISLMKKQLNHN